MANLRIQEGDDGVVFTAKIVPGSSRTTVSGILDGMVKIKVSAQPEKGKANRRLVEFLAKKLGVKKKEVEVVSGHTSPLKKVRVAGISAEMLLEGLFGGGNLG